CGSLFPLRADTPAPDLNDLAAWAADRLDEGFSFEPETLWGDLSFLKVLRDTVTIGLVYESLDRSGCGSCAHLDLRIVVLGDSIAALEARRSSPGGSKGAKRHESLDRVIELEGRLLRRTLAGDDASLLRALERRLPGLGERLRDVGFLVEMEDQWADEKP
ncbi:hypothetical protein JXA88_15075, partial [Candidatus Fermentibacteria bacterium]|nr:hypothetical protein [Candidatus Fermentibacteria bacterium]